MSIPARDLTEFAPERRVVRHTPERRPVSSSSAHPVSDPKRPATPARTTAARPQTPIPPQLRRRARRGPHPAFLIFSAAVVVAMTVGVVALNAMLAQVAFAVHAVQIDVTHLTEEHEVLVKEVATASAPNRVAEWARGQGMVMPERVVILTVPGVVRPRRR